MLRLIFVDVHILHSSKGILLLNIQLTLFFFQQQQ